VDAFAQREWFEQILRESLDSGEPAIIVARRPCVLAAGRIRKFEKAAQDANNAAVSAEVGE